VLLQQCLERAETPTVGNSNKGQIMKSTETTTSPVQIGDTTQTLPEWGRLKDIERLFSIRRGTCYALIKSKRIRSCLLRVQGRVSGCRLVHLQSVRDFISSQVQENERKEVVE
jgi:hypothetical protein